RCAPCAAPSRSSSPTTRNNPHPETRIHASRILPMNTILLILAALALVALGLFLLARERRQHRRAHLVGALNTIPDEQVGTHGPEGISRLTDAAFASKYLLATFGSDGEHV